MNLSGLSTYADSKFIDMDEVFDPIIVFLPTVAPILFSVSVLISNLSNTASITMSLSLMESILSVNSILEIIRSGVSLSDPFLSSLFSESIIATLALSRACLLTST